MNGPHADAGRPRARWPLCPAPCPAPCHARTLRAPLSSSSSTGRRSARIAAAVAVAVARLALLDARCQARSLARSTRVGAAARRPQGLPNKKRRAAGSSGPGGLRRSTSTAQKGSKAWPEPRPHRTIHNSSHSPPTLPVQRDRDARHNADASWCNLFSGSGRCCSLL